MIVSFEMAWFYFILGYYSMVGRGCLDGGEDFLGEGGEANQIISQVKIVSSSKSLTIFLPTTISTYSGEIPVPGLFGIKSSFLIVSPAFMLLV